MNLSQVRVCGGSYLQIRANCVKNVCRGRLVLERVALIPYIVMFYLLSRRHTCSPSLPLAYLSQKLLKGELF